MADQHPVVDETAPWLPLSDAASRLGLSVDAIRSRIRRGALAARRGNDNRLFVQVPADLHLVQDEAGDQAAVVAELHHEIGDLRVELARAEERAKAAETTATAQVEAKERYVRQLEELLAAANRPWWRKLLG